MCRFVFELILLLLKIYLTLDLWVARSYPYLLYFCFLLGRGKKHLSETYVTTVKNTRAKTQSSCLYYHLWKTHCSADALLRPNILQIIHLSLYPSLMFYFTLSLSLCLPLCLFLCHLTSLLGHCTAIGISYMRALVFADYRLEGYWSQ